MSSIPKHNAEGEDELPQIPENIEIQKKTIEAKQRKKLAELGKTVSELQVGLYRLDHSAED